MRVARLRALSYGPGGGQDVANIGREIEWAMRMATRIRISIMEALLVGVKLRDGDIVYREE